MAGNNSDTIKKDMITALEASLGVVSDACKSVNISRQTHYRWLEEDAEYKAEVDSLLDYTLDFVEGKLHSLIKDGDTSATIFYLKTKGKKRGYVERQEIQHESAGINLNIIMPEGE